MLSANKKEPLILLLGDILSLLLALWLSLYFRYFEFPSMKFFDQHVVSFSVLFLTTLVSFFIAGLYDKQRIMLKRRIPELLFNAALVNALIAIVFFYFIPLFGLAPKTILFIYIVFSTLVLFAWRIPILSLLETKRLESAMLIAGGVEAIELKEEINNNSRYGFSFSIHVEPSAIPSLDFEKDLLERIYEENVSLIAIDSKDSNVTPLLSRFYNLIFSQIRFVDINQLYEEVFDRIPVSLLRYDWFLEHISSAKRGFYDGAKRVMDVLISFPLFLVSLIFYPFVWIGEKFEGNGSLWSFQERVGQYGRLVRLIKFRTMLFDDNGKWIAEGNAPQNKVTKFGQFLRKSRIDELPQLINVLKGDISLIGPRPEFPKAVNEYTREIPYYNVRHIIKPGLSGWAQIYHTEHPHHGIDIKETKNKLSYDIFYIKNRSIVLDIVIALKTIKTLLSREGL